MESVAQFYQNVIFEDSKVRQGNNYLKLDLSKVGLIPKDIYTLIFTNPKGKKYYLRFSLRIN